jgi:hypothetical protein
MQLKQHYVSREVTALTGLSAKQLQWWDRHRLMQASVAAQRTAAGGFTERRYSPTDLLELVVLADLRRKGSANCSTHCGNTSASGSSRPPTMAGPSR